MSNQKFDARSEKNLLTLLPEARPVFRALLADLLAAGFHAQIIDGSRTYAEQNALYAKGRGAGGNIVTKARGGQSFHNFGIAVDIGLFSDKACKHYLKDSPQYGQIGKIGESLGLEWGGRWGFVDEPHFQMKTGLSLSQLRYRHDNNIPILAATTKPASAVKATKTIRLIVDGEDIQEVGVNADGDTIAPVRAIAEALECDVVYDPVTRTIRITKRAISAK